MIEVCVALLACASNSLNFTLVAPGVGSKEFPLMTIDIPGRPALGENALINGCA